MNLKSPTLSQWGVTACVCVYKLQAQCNQCQLRVTTARAGPLSTCKFTGLRTGNVEGLQGANLAPVNRPVSPLAEPREARLRCDLKEEPLALCGFWYAVKV